MGRTLQNTMVNLALENACDEATYQVPGLRDPFSYRGGGGRRVTLGSKNILIRDRCVCWEVNQVFTIIGKVAFIIQSICIYFVLFANEM